MVQHEKYSSASRELLGKAQEALARGDLVQASEKGWGAAAQAVNAVAEQRGWPHNGQVYLFRAVRRLVEETGDPQLDIYSHVANSLHSNFYENWLPADSVQSGLEAVQNFVEKLEQLSI